VQWFAQGFDTLPNVEEEDDAFVQGTIFTEGVTGTAIGPDKNSSVDVAGERPAQLGIRRPQPNPSSGSVTVTFELPEVAQVELAVYDISGRRIRVLASGRIAAGIHSVTWAGQADAGGTAQPGIYFYRLSVNGKPAGERRVTILR
jgi:flagellar hook assembly protein FlgD